MSMTDIEIKQWVENYVNTNPGYDWATWNDETYKYGLHHKFDAQLSYLQSAFQAKLTRLYALYRGFREGFVSSVSDSFVQVTSEDSILDLKLVKDKGRRIAEKWRAVNAEVEGRTLGIFGPGESFDRRYVGTDYYIDLDNGQDTRTGVNPDGLKHGNYTADSGTGTTTLVETSELARTSSGDWDGAYLYNVTRSAGALITNSTYSAGTWTLTHGTISSQASGDTYYILDAWLTIQQYISATTRSPGDNGYVRANTSQILAAANHEFDEDGNTNNRISIIGCDSVTNDPWGDGSDVVPEWDWNGNSANFWRLSADLYWHFNRMRVTGSANSNYGGFYFSGTFGTTVEDCDFSDNSTHGATTFSYTSLEMTNCSFNDNTTSGFNLGSGTQVVFRSCEFDGGSGGQDTGLYVAQNGRALCVNCSFGQTNAHDNEDINVQYQAEAHLISCLHNDDFSIFQGGVIYSEDDNQTFGNHESWHVGTVTVPHKKDTTNIRTGGADSSFAMAVPGGSDNVGLYFPLTVCGKGYRWNYPPNWPWKLWLESGSKTITLYIKTNDTWGVYPTASQLYVVASYVSNGTTGARTEVESTDVLTGTGWTGFDVTVNPAVDSMVYLNVVLKLNYGASQRYLYIDTLPVIS